MDQEANRIKAHIDSERASLDRSLREFESRIRAAADLPAHFRRRPWVWAGAAFGAGAALGAAARSRKNAHGSEAGPTAPRFPRASSQLQSLVDTADDMISALLGIGARSLPDALAGVIPGFEGELDRIRRRRTEAASSGVERTRPPLVSAG